MMPHGCGFPVELHSLVNIRFNGPALLKRLPDAIPCIRIFRLHISIKGKRKITFNVPKSSAVDIPETRRRIQQISLPYRFLIPSYCFIGITFKSDTIFVNSTNVIQDHSLKLLTLLISLSNSQKQLHILLAIALGRFRTICLPRENRADGNMLGHIHLNLIIHILRILYNLI